MGKFTAAQIEENAKRLMAAFDDGFQWKDVFDLIPNAMEIVNIAGGMTTEEKEESALAIVDYIVDETDLPWLPDNLIDPIIKKAARYMIPKLIEAAEGKLNIT